ncbi:hypothetical protein F2Q69_00032418 [Brassica cretica]|uniref:F-box associated beta-propeller type 3 domain-containing protein n=1 Tax=Brassica cretica TaxID=69181 RepID=A0A8S9RT05_BRACR|nr:hypothetical protein F2Q69_00032418 [Brassica cretica]
MKTRKRVGIVRFLGYDPVEKLHKVLGMVHHRNDRTIEHHQVLTLGGTEKATWRMTECVEMWVLEDPERREWCKHVYRFPPMWEDVVDRQEWLVIVGVTGPNEFVMRLHIHLNLSKFTTAISTKKL